MRCVRRLLLVSVLLTAALAAAHAEVRVTGRAGDLRVDARKATVAQVLAALKQQHDLSVRGAAANRVVSGTFEGSLHYVLERVLDGYDYVIEHNGGALDVIVLSDGAPHAAQAAQPIIVVKRRAD
jgi:hypothetical protein